MARMRIFSAKLLPVVTQALTPLSEGFSKWADAIKPDDYQKFADAIGTAAQATARTSRITRRLIRSSAPQVITAAASSNS